MVVLERWALCRGGRFKDVVLVQSWLVWTGGVSSIAAYYLPFGRSDLTYVRRLLGARGLKII